MVYTNNRVSMSAYETLRTKRKRQAIESTGYATFQYNNLLYLLDDLRHIQELIANSTLLECHDTMHIGYIVYWKDPKEAFVTCKVHTRHIEPEYMPIFGSKESRNNLIRILTEA